MLEFLAAYAGFVLGLALGLHLARPRRESGTDALLSRLEEINRERQRERLEFEESFREADRS